MKLNPSPFVLRFRWLLPAFVVLAGGGGCTPDEEQLGSQWTGLARPGPGTPFHPVKLQGLPEPAQRFIRWAMEPGTPIPRAVELEMKGALRLQADGEWLAMEAQQVLAPPEGFIWMAALPEGWMRIRGFDRYHRGEGELRWRLWGVLPVMTATGEDVTRSAAGRLAMEAVLVPGTLLTTPGVRWRELEGDSVGFVFPVGGEEVESVLVVDERGRPLRVSARRWRPQGEGWDTAGYDRFDVAMAGEWRRDGYAVPTSLEAGWRMGEAEGFAFFRAELTSFSYR